MQQALDFLQQTAFKFNDHGYTYLQLLAVPTVLVFGYWLIRAIARMIERRMSAKKASQDAIHLVQRLFYVLSAVILVITVLDLVDVPLTAFAFVSGAVAIGFGFGAQNIINNFISGWILMWERPIRIGDFLEVETNRGTVESINTRSTRIRRVDGVHLLIPNSKLLENTVVNWTLVDRVTRTSVRVGVAYGSPVKEVARLIEQATVERDDILKDPAPVVIFEDFADNALVFDVYLWVNATADRDLRVIRSKVRFRIDELFDQNGIVIAFPQRDVHLDGSLTLINDKAGE